MSILKKIEDVKGITTAHGIGIKQVLLRDGDTDSAVTQIAVTVLNTGETVEEHIHHTMDEHYIILTGKGEMFIEGKRYELNKETYLLISKGERHTMKALSDMKFIIIGIAYDK